MKRWYYIYIRRRIKGDESVKKIETIIDILNKRIDKFCEIMLGDDYDSDGFKYSSVYRHEFANLWDTIEGNLKSIKEAGVGITTEVLKIQIISNWFCEAKRINVEELEVFLHSLLEEVNRTAFIVKEFNINERDKDLLKKLLSQCINSNRKILLQLTFDEKERDQTTKIIYSFKETDLEHFKNVVNSLKQEYIDALNLAYKLFGDKPTDWETGNNLHKHVCRAYEIKREEFIF